MDENQKPIYKLRRKEMKAEREEKIKESRKEKASHPDTS